MSEALNLGRGAALPQPFNVKDVADAAFDLTDAALVFTVSDPDRAQVFQLKSVAAGGSADQIEISSPPTGGECIVKILSAHTDLLTGPEYSWSLVLMLADEPYVLASGPAFVSPIAGLEPEE